MYVKSERTREILREQITGARVNRALVRVFSHADQGDIASRLDKFAMLS